MRARNEGNSAGGESCREEQIDSDDLGGGMGTLRKRLKGQNKGRGGRGGDRDVAEKGRSTGGSAAKAVATLAAVALVAGALLAHHLGRAGPRETTPFGEIGKRGLLVDGIGAISDGKARERGYWGTYRSTVYFGMRAKTKHSLVFGAMWWDPRRPQTFTDLRHNAENGHGLSTYGWTRHDGETFGKQALVDGDVRLEVSWAKRATSDGELEGGFGGDFGIRIRADREYAEEDTGQVKEVCVIFYVLDESLALRGGGESSASFKVAKGEQAKRDEKAVHLASGYRDDVKEWALHLARAQEARPGDVQWSSVGEEVSHVHNLTAFAQSRLYQTYQERGGMPQFSNGVSDCTNLGMFQFMVPLGRDLDLVFNSGLERRDKAARAGKLRDAPSFANILTKVAALSGERMTDLLDACEKRFDGKFDEVFPIKSGEAKEVAKRALSNLVGSIGYFVGNILVAAKGGTKIEEYPTRALFTAVPSRSFFPRGFLWDEGFHQLVIQKWNGRLSREMMATWFDLMNAEGWIPREAILGDEALVRVPSEFVVQNPSHANPPSMLISLHKMALAVKRGTEGQESEEKEFLEGIYDHLKVWFNWFTRTQKGPVPQSFRWRGRDPLTTRELNPKTLTSGLDDYPRATHPTDSERHLDLRCWMALGARTMAEIAEIVKAPSKDIREYKGLAASLEDEKSLNDLHYEDNLGMYFDWGHHTDAVALVRARDANGQDILYREVGEDSPAPQLVKEFGYVSLFPLMMRLIDAESQILGDHLKHLRDESLLWTPYGLRSLATNSKYYDKYNTEHDKPYWRSPIWININYLVLDALSYYGAKEGPHREEAKRLYEELRSNLVRNIVNQYNRTGFLWENYNDKSGVGMGSHPFTGWTSLFILIASDV